MSAPPIAGRWNGEGFDVLPRFLAACDAYFVIGKVYAIAGLERRSRKSHNHFFAVIATAWANLPEAIAGDFATPEHLRARALIAAGFYEEKPLAFANDAEAARQIKLATFLHPFAEVAIGEGFLLVRIPKSQKEILQDAATFQKCKDSVFAILSEMIGVDVLTLEKNAGMAA